MYLCPPPIEKWYLFLCILLQFRKMFLRISNEDLEPRTISFVLKSCEVSRVWAAWLCRRGSSTAPVMDLLVRIDYSKQGLFGTPGLDLDMSILSKTWILCSSAFFILRSWDGFCSTSPFVMKTPLPLGTCTPAARKTYHDHWSYSWRPYSIHVILPHFTALELEWYYVLSLLRLLLCNRSWHTQVSIP